RTVDNAGGGPALWRALRQVGGDRGCSRSRNAQPQGDSDLPRAGPVQASSRSPGNILSFRPQRHLRLGGPESVQGASKRPGEHPVIQTARRYLLPEGLGPFMRLEKAPENILSFRPQGE